MGEAVLEGALARGLKAALARGTLVSGAARRARHRHGSRLRILMYHGVVEERRGPAAFGDLFISAAEFARQMRYLKQAFQVIALDEAIETMERRGTFPDRAVTITFDDGYRNVVTTAWPILRALKLPATVFVIPEHVDRGDPLWFDALRLLIDASGARRRRLDLGAGVALDGTATTRPGAAFLMLNRHIRSLPRDQREAMQQRLMTAGRESRLFERHPEFALAGWEEWRRLTAEGLVAVGSHGLTHRDLADLLFEDQVSELRQSKRAIERELARACRAVAYPYGTWNEMTAEAARTAGYACAVTTDDGLNAVDHPRFWLRRTMIGDKGNFSLFRARVSGVWDQLREGAARRRPSPAIACGIHLPGIG